MRFHHIGLLVSDLEEGKAALELVDSSVKWSKSVADELIGVQVVFGTDRGRLRYELVSPLGINSPISNFMEKKENMFHHIAYETKNFDEKCSELRRLKFLPLGVAMPAVAFGGKRVAFYLTPLRTIIEIIES